MSVCHSLAGPQPSHRHTHMSLQVILLAPSTIIIIILVPLSPYKAGFPRLHLLPLHFGLGPGSISMIFLSLTLHHHHHHPTIAMTPAYFMTYRPLRCEPLSVCVCRNDQCSCSHEAPFTGASPASLLTIQSNGLNHCAGGNDDAEPRFVVTISSPSSSQKITIYRSID